MASLFDPRVMTPGAVDLVRHLQRRAPCRLVGGAALSGAHLHHRLSADIDLFCQTAEDVRAIVRDLATVARETGASIEVVRDAGSFVRCTARMGKQSLDLDVAYDAAPDLEPPPPPIEGVIVASFADLRANKITCLLSRSEPRDLVDALFLERAGYPTERDLPLALQKDAGIEPGALAWLLRDFPTSPLPEMLVPLEETELVRFRDALSERMRRLAVPG